LNSLRCELIELLRRVIDACMCTRVQSAVKFDVWRHNCSPRAQLWRTVGRLPIWLSLHT